MRKRKYSQLKRNPVVRLIRSIIKFFRKLFNPKKRASKLNYDRQQQTDEMYYLDPLTSITELSEDRGIESITVGELLEQVKWQSSSKKDRSRTSSSSNKIPEDASVN